MEIGWLNIKIWGKQGEVAHFDAKSHAENFFANSNNYTIDANMYPCATLYLK